MALVDNCNTHDAPFESSHQRLAELLDASSFALYLARRALLTGDADPASVAQFRYHLRSALATLTMVEGLLEMEPAAPSDDVTARAQPGR